MGEEPVIVVAGAEGGDRDAADAGGAGVRCDEGAEIHRGGCRDGATCQLGVNFGAHFVALAADRGTEVNVQAGGREAPFLEEREGALGYARSRAAPTRMQERERPSRVRDEDGHAVGDRHGERDADPEREVAIGVGYAKPPFPIAVVRHYAVAVHLARGGEARRHRAEVGDEPVPARHHLRYGLGTPGAERARCACGSEGFHPERFEFGDDFALDHALPSVTRVIFAPSERRRSSIRS